MLAQLSLLKVALRVWAKLCSKVVYQDLRQIQLITYMSILYEYLYVLL